MRIVWDEPKRLANVKKHGLDFSDVVDFEWGSAVLLPARSGKYGGHRSKAISYCFGEAVVVIFSLLGTEAISIISFRPANKKERSMLDAFI